MILSDDIFKLDEAAEVARIAASMRQVLGQQLHRRGFIIAISGGVDSAVCAALCVRAVGAKKVFGLLLPERDSSSRPHLKFMVIPASIRSQRSTGAT